MLKELSEHNMVPRHILLTKEEAQVVFKKFGVQDPSNFPMISSSDPLVKELDAKKNDVIKIVRKSDHAGSTIFYRRVV